MNCTPLSRDDRYRIEEMIAGGKSDLIATVKYYAHLPTDEDGVALLDENDERMPPVGDLETIPIADPNRHAELARKMGWIVVNGAELHVRPADADPQT